MNELRNIWQDAFDIFLDLTAMIAAFILGVIFVVYELGAWLIRKIWRLFK